MFVQEYLMKRTLSKIGFRFSADDMMDYELEALALCHVTFAELEEKQREREERVHKLKHGRR